MLPSINNQVLFCVTALQDTIQLHLTTQRVVGLFLTSQHFSQDRYKTSAINTRLRSPFHLMADHHIHIHDIHRHVKAHTPVLVIFMSNPGVPVDENHERTGLSVTTVNRRQTRRLFHSVSLSFCPLPVSRTPLDNHTHTHIKASINRLSHTHTHTE